MLFLLWGYFMLTESTLDYFDCKVDDIGKYWMRGDPAMVRRCRLKRCNPYSKCLALCA